MICVLLLGWSWNSSVKRSYKVLHAATLGTKSQFFSESEAKATMAISQKIRDHALSRSTLWHLLPKNEKKRIRKSAWKAGASGTSPVTQPSFFRSTSLFLLCNLLSLKSADKFAKANYPFYSGKTQAIIDHHTTLQRVKRCRHCGGNNAWNLSSGPAPKTVGA